ncbi:MAG: sugar transferase [Paracoccaceae bacterium]
MIRLRTPSASTAADRARAKRRFDLAAALVLLLPLGPLMAAIALLLLAVQGRPVFFASERMRGPDAGFTLWKFRTMRPALGGPGVTGGHVAARVTAAGRVLRRLRLDELPQLWNVIRGDMSLVGPRPPVRAVVERFPETYREVLATLPGVTGFATVMFHRREAAIMAPCRTESEAALTYGRRCVRPKAAYDRFYARRSCLSLDLAIIAATVAGGLRRGRVRPVRSGMRVAVPAGFGRSRGPARPPQRAPARRGGSAVAG